MIQSEGRSYYRDVGFCPDCKAAEAPRIRCKECFGQELLCKGCTVKRHSRLPLHRIEVRFLFAVAQSLAHSLKEWDIATGSFKASSLHSLGLRIQLGHAQGTLCPLTQSRDLVVLHTNGIHRVKVDFCKCSSKSPRWQQLLRVEWLPATPLEPQTAATFEVLRQFHYQNLQGNITAYDFYRALEFLSDGRLTDDLPVSSLTNKYLRDD